MSETQRVVAAAATVETVTDARGRSITVKKLSRRDTMKLMRQWGAASDVQMWLGNAMMAAHATVIDGVPLLPPTSPDAVEANVDRLDDDGIAAVADWLVTSRAVEQADAAKNL